MRKQREEAIDVERREKEKLLEENDSNIKNTASLLHSLVNKVDENILGELQKQMMDYSENIDLLEEFKGIQNSFSHNSHHP